MLPVEKATGQIFLYGKFLCNVEYDISEPLHVSNLFQVQCIMLTVDDEHCTPLLAAYELTLVVADGERFSLPRPIQRNGHLECYIETRQ